VNHIKPVSLIQDGLQLGNDEWKMIAIPGVTPDRPINDRRQSRGGR